MDNLCIGKKHEWRVYKMATMQSNGEIVFGSCSVLLPCQAIHALASPMALEVGRHQAMVPCLAAAKGEEQNISHTSENSNTSS